MGHGAEGDEKVVWLDSGEEREGKIRALSRGGVMQEGRVTPRHQQSHPSPSLSAFGSSSVKPGGAPDPKCHPPETSP